MSSDASNTFVGRQPILDRDERIVGYELLYRSSARAQHADYPEQSAAASRVLINTFASLGVDTVLGDALGFFNVTSEVLKTGVLGALPPDRVVIEVLENVVVDPDVEECCRELVRDGFRLALDDYVEGAPREAMLEWVHLVKVDVLAVPRARLKRLVRTLRRHPVEILAEKVETQEDRERCAALGFDYFQGYFFARPVILEGHSVDPEREVLLDLLGKIYGEADTTHLVDALKRNPSLGVNLLRVVNSAAMAKATPIERVEDAVNYLGRRHLGRWVAILLFAGSGEDGVRSPLLMASAHRGRLMELLVREALDGAGADQGERAFLVGILSFLDVLLHQPRESVLADLHLHDEVNSALLGYDGVLGRLLRVCEHLLDGEHEQLESGLADLGLELAPFSRAEQEAFTWVDALRQA